MKRAPARRQTFVTFCLEVLGLKLSAPWLVLLRVCIDGVQPRDLAGAERTLAGQLFGDVDEIDPRVRRVLIWRLGRGSGKTTLAAALAIYEAWTSDTSRAGPGQVPTAFLVAPTRPLATIGQTIARELVRNSALEANVAGDTRDGFLMRRPVGRVVAIRSVAASRGGANLRGVDVIVLVLDESEFFASGADGEYAVTDRDQIAAVMPRLIGYVLCISTPWPTDNVTAEYFDGNFAKPTSAVAVLGASLLMRPSGQLAQDRDREMLRDPENAAREYDCEAGVRGGSRLFVEGLKEAVIEDRPLSIRAPTDAVIGCGGDLGLERDSSAIAIIARVEDLYELCEFDELRPTKGQPLSPRYVIRDRFAPIMHRHGAQSIMMDAHYRQSAIDNLEAVQLVFEDAPTGVQGKYDSYMFLRAQFRAQKLRLPNSPRLLAQLRAVTATPMPGGGTRISSPRRAGGGHGDVVSAIVLAAWQAGGSATGRRMPCAGLFEWYKQEAAKLTGGPMHAIVAEPEERECVELVAPAKFAASSHFIARSGRMYAMQEGRIRSRLSDIDDFTRLGFRHATD